MTRQPASPVWQRFKKLHVFVFLFLEDLEIEKKKGLRVSDCILGGGKGIRTIGEGLV